MELIFGRSLLPGQIVRGHTRIEIILARIPCLQKELMCIGRPVLHLGLHALNAQLHHGVVEIQLLGFHHFDDASVFTRCRCCAFSDN